MNPKEIAQHVLLEHGISALPVNVHSICRQQRITVLYDDEAKTWEGIATVVRGQPYILLRCGLSPERERYVLAHEIGHLIQGHVGSWRTVADRPALPRPIQEREATTFGMELIMPETESPFSSADEIQRSCGVSRPLAMYRYTQLSGNAQKRATTRKERAVCVTNS